MKLTSAQVIARCRARLMEVRAENQLRLASAEREREGPLPCPAAVGRTRMLVMVGNSIRRAPLPRRFTVERPSSSDRKGVPPA
jgi:hypothetical protein